MDNNKKNKNLTILEAFEAMQDFLIQYYERTSSDDVGSLLADIPIHTRWHNSRFCGMGRLDRERRKSNK